MGWNGGYTIFEQTVIGAYDLGKLDADLLSVLMEPYRNTDIDSGGCMGLISGDGKDIRQIVIETFGGTYPKRPKLPRNFKTWTTEQSDANDKFCDDVANAFRDITDKFGWV